MNDSEKNIGFKIEDSADPGAECNEFSCCKGVVKENLKLWRDKEKTSYQRQKLNKNSEKSTSTLDVSSLEEYNSTRGVGSNISSAKKSSSVIESLHSQEFAGSNDIVRDEDGPTESHKLNHKSTFSNSAVIEDRNTDRSYVHHQRISKSTLDVSSSGEYTCEGQKGSNISKTNKETSNVTASLHSQEFGDRNNIVRDVDGPTQSHKLYRNSINSYSTVVDDRDKDRSQVCQKLKSKSTLDVSSSEEYNSKSREGSNISKTNESRSVNASLHSKEFGGRDNILLDEDERKTIHKLSHQSACSNSAFVDDRSRGRSHVHHQQISKSSFDGSSLEEFNTKSREGSKIYNNNKQGSAKNNQNLGGKNNIVRDEDCPKESNKLNQNSRNSYSAVPDDTVCSEVHYQRKSKSTLDVSSLEEYNTKSREGSDISKTNESRSVIDISETGISWNQQEFVGRSNIVLENGPKKSHKLNYNSTDNNSAIVEDINEVCFHVHHKPISSSTSDVSLLIEYSTKAQKGSKTSKKNESSCVHAILHHQEFGCRNNTVRDEDGHKSQRGRYARSDVRLLKSSEGYCHSEGERCKGLLEKGAINVQTSEYDSEAIQNSPEVFRSAEDGVESNTYEKNNGYRHLVDKEEEDSCFDNRLLVPGHDVSRDTYLKTEVQQYQGFQSAKHKCFPNNICRSLSPSLGNIYHADEDEGSAGIITEVNQLHNGSCSQTMLGQGCDNQALTGLGTDSDDIYTFSRASELSGSGVHSLNEELLLSITDAVVQQYSNLGDDQVVKAAEERSIKGRADIPIVEGCRRGIRSLNVQTLNLVDRFHPTIYEFQGDIERRPLTEPLLHATEVTKKTLEDLRHRTLAKTQACQDAVYEADLGRNVIIKGDRCSGVTSTLHSILLELDKRKTFRVIKISSSNDFRDCLNTKGSFVIFIDDFNWKDWASHLVDMKTYAELRRGVVIIGMKNDIYKKYQDELKSSDFFKDGYVIDLSGPTYAISKEEILAILEQHETSQDEIKKRLSSTELTEISQCLLPKFALEYIKEFYENIGNRQQGIDFFKKPNKTLLEFLKNLKKEPEGTNKYKILTRGVLETELVPADSQMEDNRNEMDGLKYLRKLKAVVDKNIFNSGKKVCEESEYRKDIDILKSLGFIFETDQGSHIVTSEAIRIAIWLTLLEEYPEETVMVCSFQVISDSIRQNIKHKYEFNVLAEHKRALAKRFTHEILRGNVDEVASQPMFNEKKFSECFSHYVCTKRDHIQWKLWSMRDRQSGNTLVVNLVKHPTGVAEKILMHPIWRKHSSPHSTSCMSRFLKQMKRLIQCSCLIKENSLEIDVKDQNIKALSNAIAFDNISAFKCIRKFGTPVNGDHFVQAIESESYTILECLLPDYDLVDSACPEAFLAASRVYSNKFNLESREKIRNVMQTLLERLPKDFVVNENLETTMHLAVDEKNIDAIKLLLGAGHMSDPTDRMQETPLHWSIKHNYEAAVVCLLEKGASVQIPNTKGETALHLAVGQSDRIMRLLVKHASNVDSKDVSGMTPLHIACKNCKKTCVEILLEAKADTLAKDKNERQPLHYASENEYEIVELLVLHGANVNASDNMGTTPMHIVAIKGHTLSSQILLNNGANILSRDNKGRSPLYLAMKHEQNDVLLNMSEKCTDNVQCLFQVAKHGNAIQMEYFLRNTTVKNMNDVSGKPLIEEAVESGNTETATCLLRRKLNADFRSQGGFPLTFIATYHDDCAMLELLLQYGADITACDEITNMVIHICCARGNLQILEVILNVHPPLINKRNSKGWTPLHFAAYCGRPDITELLLRCKAFITAKTSRGELPIELAMAGSKMCDKVTTIDGLFMTKFGSLVQYKQVCAMLEGSIV